MEAQTSFAELPEEQQPEHMGVESSGCVHWMVDYICAHPGAGEAAALLCGGDQL